MASYPPPATPPRTTPPRSASLPLARTRLAPRSDSLPHSAPSTPPRLTTSPRFESTHLRTPPASASARFVSSPRQYFNSPSHEDTFTFQPRRLFADPQPLSANGMSSGVNASQETIDITMANAREEDEDDDGKFMAGIVGAYHPRRSSSSDEDEVLSYPEVAYVKQSPPRPLALDLNSSTAAAAGIHFAPSASNPATPPSPDDSISPPPSKKQPIVPSIALLFSLTTKSTLITIIIPAILFSIVCGLVPPYMTETLGNAFGAFTDYTVSTSGKISAKQLAAARHLLLSRAETAAIKFAALAATIFIAASFSQTLWLINGERTAMKLREEVFNGVSKKELEWFDLGMGADMSDEDQAGQGAGGLMGRFTKESDEVRIASSRVICLIMQYLVSFFACLLLSFYRNWKLTLAILATVPMITLVVALTERYANPLNYVQNEISSQGSSFVDRTIGAMPTVKAFNAEEMELSAFQKLQNVAAKNYSILHFIWGVRTGVTQFLLFSMFVQGFWFGSYLVEKGEATAAIVNTCFWSCLLASTYLQLCVPMLVDLEKGKMSMASLTSLAREEVKEPVAVLVRPLSHSTSKRRRFRRQPSESNIAFASQGVVNNVWTKDEEAALDDSIISPHPFQLTSFRSSLSPTSPTLIPLSSTLTSAGSKRRSKRGARPRALRKVRPTYFSGELGLSNVTFHYPSRPHPAPPALKNVSLFVASQEITYIVGGSGSGKSTVGSLLLGLYKPELGQVEVEGQGLEWIDENWLRGHVTCVSQGASVLFEGTVHENVAIGVTGQLRPDGTFRKAEDVTREEVVAACRGALVREFIRDLPDGYDTYLSGEKGASLSGGQRQRLALARVWIRDPTVLVLDEATSALDATSRLLVSEAVKLWRRNKTTIIITHDLSPIEQADFVYVMEDGVVVEQGYRETIESNIGGPFYTLARTHLDDDARSSTSVGEEEEVEELSYTDGTPSVMVTPPRSTRTTPHGSPRTPRNLNSSPVSQASAAFGLGLAPSPGDLSRLREARRNSANFTEMQERRASGQLAPSPTPSSRRGISPHPDDAPPQYDRSYFRTDGRRDSSMSFAALDKAAQFTKMGRTGGPRMKHKTMVFATYDPKSEWRKPEGDEAVVIRVESPSSSSGANLSLFQIVRRVYPSIPDKGIFFTGLLLSVVVGACTPIFSTLLSILIANLGNPQAGSLVVRTSLLILLVAFVEGFGTLIKFWLFERCGMNWITSLRVKAMGHLLKQDKSYFDEHDNTTSHLVHTVIQDTADARPIIGTLTGQFTVVISMLLVGLIWAVVIGWKLTLVGFALGPVFVLAVRGQAIWQGKYEAKNKILRESVGKKFHNNVANIRAIRSMAIESVFNEKFRFKNEETYRGGVKAAPLAGLGFAIGSSLTFATEAIMFYVGAILVTRGTYDFAKTAEVFSLIIFSLTFASQIMNYLPGLSKASRAYIDFARLLELQDDTRESEGKMTFPIKGRVTFDQVQFAYPSREDVQVLKGMSFDVMPGECVGIVGASGSGKSTVAALLQRLYEPSSGSVLLDGRPLSRIDVRYLRDHIGMVSQHPTLFDMSIAANISYGCPPDTVTEVDIELAAKKAHVHDFIVSLPRGYQTMLGENASLISGGQAQRLQIARALLREREILILDECTSALDPTNQAAIMETLMEAKVGKTTLIITHKLAVMEKCDRLLVVGSGGVVIEQGTVAELRARPNGLFATLASGGEWEG